jgi:hypothetical protein
MVKRSRYTPRLRADYTTRMSPLTTPSRTLSNDQLTEVMRLEGNNGAVSLFVKLGLVDYEKPRKSRKLEREEFKKKQVDIFSMFEEDERKQR